MSQGALLADKLESWAKSLTDTAQSIRSSSSQDDVAQVHRMNIAQTANNISRSVQQPAELLMAAMPTVAQLAVFRLFIKWKVFESIPTEGYISYHELAGKVGADTSLIRRFAWILVSTGVLEQVGQDEVSHTPTSKTFATFTPLSAVLQMFFDDHVYSLVSLPDYFEKYGLKEPTGRYDTVFAYCMGDPKLTVWEHLNRHPERMNNFMASMVAMAQRFPVTGSYDFGWLATKAQESNDRTLIVDVGGGKGHALETICKATPGIPASRCVVEDLPEVVEAAKEAAEGDLASASFVAMDFHSEQPIKGAWVYYIRRCLHDYGDDDAADMLRQIQRAMVSDSRLLIVEEVLSNPPTAIAAATDLVMATIGGKERTLEDFKVIASRAGLKVVEAHRTEGTGVAVIECAKD